MNGREILAGGRRHRGIGQLGRWNRAGLDRERNTPRERERERRRLITFAHCLLLFRTRDSTRWAVLAGRRRVCKSPVWSSSLSSWAFSKQDQWRPENMDRSGTARPGWVVKPDSTGKGYINNNYRNKREVGLGADPTRWPLIRPPPRRQRWPGWPASDQLRARLSWTHASKLYPSHFEFRIYSTLLI